MSALHGGQLKAGFLTSVQEQLDQRGVYQYMRDYASPDEICELLEDCITKAGQVHFSTATH
eukprot:3258717-Pyramimonas_sp.AAC.1